MSKEVKEIDPQLAANLKTAKANLAIAKQGVEDAEAAIYTAAESFLPEKGTTHVTGVKIVTAVDEKWDQDKLAEIEKTWPRKSNLPFPFKKEFKADTKQITYLRENAVDAYAELEPALTSKPKKPSFTIEDDKE
jgi:hypothetical protein